MEHRINISFDAVSLWQPFVSGTVRKCIRKTLEMQGVTVPCEINVLITNDQGIRAINATIRSIDKPTDVLSFPMFDLEAGVLPEDWSEYMDPETDMCPLGDMVISLERAIAQAREFGHTSRREIGYLTIHSVLHLLGYDHMDEGEQKAAMRTAEEKIAAQLPGMMR